MKLSETTNKPQLYLDGDKARLTTYLVQQGWLAPHQRIRSIEKPGEGNMNLVLRIISDSGDPFIIKQARPWVEKYPQIQAPVERIHVEQQYYQYVNHYPKLAKYSPQIIGFDPQNHVLATQDLGDAADYTSVYQEHRFFGQLSLDAAINYLNLLHKLTPPAGYPKNLDLRLLNHQHIFVLPFAQNDFDLDKVQRGLQDLADQIKKDDKLVRRIVELGEHYLAGGNCLLHGDFYPGSLLQSKDGLKVIDPEFSFIGPAEWDLAVFIAHLFLSQTPQESIVQAFSRYQRRPTFDYEKFAGFTGAEVLRRLVGLAQLPLTIDLKSKTRLIQRSINWIKASKIDTLSGYEQNFNSH